MFAKMTAVCKLVLVVFFGGVFCGPAPETPPLQDEVAKMQALLPEYFQSSENEGISTRASESDLVYHFFTQNSPNIGVYTTGSTIAALGPAGFSAEKDTVLIFHGWKGDNISDFNNAVRQAILATQDVNLIMVDWSSTADKDYVSAMNALVSLGGLVANFIRAVGITYGLQLSKTVFIGFSLGAHLAGNAGAALDGEVDRIVGLDPAGPFYTASNIDNRLDPTDGRFVLVIHTSAGLLGIDEACGHVDYYPNGGSGQPGCGWDLLGGCSHERSHMYYSEAVLATVNNFVSRKCSSYSTYRNGQCSGNPTSRMGGYALDESATGDYFLTTNSGSPYAKG